MARSVCVLECLEAAWRESSCLGKRSSKNPLVLLCPKLEELLKDAEKKFGTSDLSPTEAQRYRRVLGQLAWAALSRVFFCTGMGAVCAERDKSPRRIQMRGTRNEPDKHDKQHQTKPQNQTPHQAKQPPTRTKGVRLKSVRV